MSDSNKTGHASYVRLPAVRSSLSSEDRPPGRPADRVPVPADRAPGPADRLSGPADGPVDRRRHRTWIPRTAALLTMLIGLSDILAIFKPEWSHRLDRINYLVPGSLTNGIRTADVIIGLLLLMLAHGLRRRKKRALQAVVALLAFDIVIRAYQPHLERIPAGVVALVLLVALLLFRDEFYAEGDPRTRWRALWVFLWVIVADIVIGLTYILAARHLATDYSLGQRIQETLYGLVGVSGPVQWVPEARGDLFNFLTSGLGIFTLLFTVYLFLRPAEPRARLAAADAGRVRELLGRHGDRDSLGYFALPEGK